MFCIQWSRRWRGAVGLLVVCHVFGCTSASDSEPAKNGGTSGSALAVVTPEELALRRKKESAIFDEIGRLQTSLEAYKDKRLVYPPCLADTDLDVRKRKFMQHLQTAFPSTYYGLKPEDFDRLNRALGPVYQVATASGKTVRLDLLALDAAESFIFWLAGFPIPLGEDGRPVASVPVFGFNRDSDAPLGRSSLEGVEPLATRTRVQFDFDPKRLIDGDEDGWWEYVPEGPAKGTAPIVYFDAATYMDRPQTNDRLATLIYPYEVVTALTWGTICPLASFVDAAGKAPPRWHNPKSFQLVCGGLDGKYSWPGAPARMTVFPSGETYVGPGIKKVPGNLDEFEVDNLTNLRRVNLGDASGEAP